MVAFIKETPLSLKDAAARVGVTVKTVRVWTHGVKGRKLESFKLGGKVYVTAEALERFATAPTEVQYVQPSASARDHAETMRLIKERHG